MKNDGRRDGMMDEDMATAVEQLSGGKEGERTDLLTKAMPPPRVSKVLVAGDAIASLSEVVSLISHHREYASSEISALPAMPITMAGLEVDTKYFTASLVFKTLEMLDSVEKITSSPVFANQANGALEGCILVCSYADQAKTFETCVRFGHVRDAMREEGQDDVVEKLQVVLYVKGGKNSKDYNNDNNTDNDTEMDASRQQYFMWSIHNSYEFIEIDLSEDLSQGWGEREKEGLPRLIEALQSRRWDSMVLKGRESEKNDYECQVNSISRNDIVNDANEISDINISTANNSNVEDDSSSKIEGDSIDILDVDKALLTTHDSKDTLVFDGMSRLIEEAKAMHQNARIGNISDSERKEKASDMALKFMEM